MGALAAENNVTLAPFSAAATAVVNPDMPPPTTMMSFSFVSSIEDSSIGSGATMNDHFGMPSVNFRTASPESTAPLVPEDCFSAPFGAEHPASPRAAAPAAPAAPTLRKSRRENP